MRVRPDQIKALRDAQNLLAGLFESKRVVRDSAYWNAPVGTPLPLPKEYSRHPLTKEQLAEVAGAWVQWNGKAQISEAAQDYLLTGQDHAIMSYDPAANFPHMWDDGATVGGLLREIESAPRQMTFRGLILPEEVMNTIASDGFFDEPLGTSTTVDHLAMAFAAGFFGDVGPSDIKEHGLYRVVMVLDGPALPLPKHWQTEKLTAALGGEDPKEHWVSGRYVIANSWEQDVTDPETGEKEPLLVIQCAYTGPFSPPKTKADEIRYDPSKDHGLWKYEFTKKFDGETKSVRHVRDAAFWGAPRGTPLPLAHTVSEYEGNRHRIVPFTLKQGPANTRYTYGDISDTAPNSRWKVAEHDYAFYRFDSWDGNYVIRTVSANIMGISGSQGRGADDLDPDQRHVVETGHITKSMSSPDFVEEQAKKNIGIGVELMAASTQWVSQQPLYRGMEVLPDSPFLNAEPGDTFTLPLSAFSPSEFSARTYAEQRGDGVPIVLELEDNARIVPGRGRPPYEVLTQGRYEVVSSTVRKIPTVRTDYGEMTNVITIRQVAYYDIFAGEWVDV